MAFYLTEYEVILRKLLKLPNFNFMTITEVKRAIDVNSNLLNKSIILRHDVDRCPKNALRMAELEHALGIKGTYYFRCNKNRIFPVAYIKKIEKLGHEVGYHYECLSDCNGNKKQALKLFKKNLLLFRKVAVCTSVAMHGKPLSSHNNLDLLYDLNLKEFDLKADAVLSFANVELVYLTDTGGRWNASSRYNLRDHVGLTTIKPLLPNDLQFIKWIQKNRQPIMLSAHPERWTKNTFNYFVAEMRDQISNLAKEFLKLLRTSKA